MDRISRVAKLHKTMSGLDSVPRKGWEAWGVKKARNESVAEHSFDTMQLAYALWAEYGDAELEKNLRESGFDGEGHLDVVGKVLPMLLNHEAEETGIGDRISIGSEDREKKKAEGQEVVRGIYAPFKNERGEKTVELIYEFDEGKTMDSQFAFLCDKLVASIRAERLKQEGYDADIREADADFQKNPHVIEMRERGLVMMSDMWRAWWRETYGDSVFGELADFVKGDGGD